MLFSDFGPIGAQPLPICAEIPDRLLCTYRAPAHALAPLAPPPFTLDTLATAAGPVAFLSVCALEVRRMGVPGTPPLLRFHNLEFLYRVAVRLHGEPTFLTLRSDVSAWPLWLLGGRFSHYRPRRADLQLLREGARLTLRCRSADGLGDAELRADLDSSAPAAPDSAFESAQAASDFLLGMKRSAGVHAGRVQTQDIDHSPWQARLLSRVQARFAFLEHLGSALSTSLQEDCTLHMTDIHQTWRATCRLKTHP